MSDDDACKEPVYTWLNIDPNDKYGYTIAVCERHLEMAYKYFPALGQTVSMTDDYGDEETEECAGEDDWDDPDGAIEGYVEGFLEKHERTVKNVLAGDRAALTELLVKHSNTFKTRPMR